MNWREFDFSVPGFPPTPEHRAEINAYYRAAEAALEGEGPVWIQRSFIPLGNSRSLDLFVDQGHVGFILQDLADMLCEAYVGGVEDNTPAELMHIGSETFRRAAALLLNEVGIHSAQTHTSH